MKDFLKKNKFLKKHHVVFLPIFALLIFLTLFILNSLLSFIIKERTILDLPFKTASIEKLPIIKTEFIPQISALGAIILDADSKVILYSKNKDLRFSSASTTKIMTALVGLNYFRPGDILTVREATVEGSVMGLKVGQQMTFENFLYAMLLPSANDAALAVSQNYPGAEATFVKKMNDYAHNFFLYNTHYEDPIGLEDAGDYTTPFDLARLASIAIKNENFAQIVSTKRIVIYDTTGNQYVLENLNELLGFEGVNGIKTGYTEEAGQVLVTSKLENGKTIIIVVMGSKDRFADTQKLLDLVSGNLSFLSIHP